MILLADVIIGQIKICLFCDLHAGMTEDFTEGENIHSVHKAPFGKVVPQTMGAIIFIQPRTVDIPLKIGFKVAHADSPAVFLDREQIITFHISVFELEPPPQNGFCFGGEVYSSVFSPLCFFRSEVDTLSGKLQIRNQQGRAFAKPHTAVQHEHNHHIVPMLCEIGLVSLLLIIIEKCSSKMRRHEKREQILGSAPLLVILAYPANQRKEAVALPTKTVMGQVLPVITCRLLN